MRRIILVLVLLAGAPACDKSVTPTNPTVISITNNNTNNNQQTVAIVMPVTPGAPCNTGCGGQTPTTPTIPGGGTGRTPDPAAGQVLSLPAYAQNIIGGVLDDLTYSRVLERACPTHGRTASFDVVDAVVDRLRTLDTRWGYVCGGGLGALSCSSVVANAIGYHATAGPDVPGAVGLWPIVIVDCNANPVKGVFALQPYDPAGVWSSRGRF